MRNKTEAPTEFVVTRPFLFAGQRVEVGTKLTDISPSDVPSLIFHGKIEPVKARIADADADAVTIIADTTATPLTASPVEIQSRDPEPTNRDPAPAVAPRPRGRPPKNRD